VFSKSELLSLEASEIVEQQEGVVTTTVIFKERFTT
jgi:hypothetical protein